MPTQGGQPGSGFQRIACCEPCQLTTSDGAAREGVVWNVSTLGVYILFNGVLPAVGELLGVSFCLPGDPRPIRSQVQVTWQNQTFFHGTGEKAPRLPPGCGVKFLDLSADDGARIRARVESLYPNSR